MTKYTSPSQLTRPPDMSWREYRAMAESLDRQWHTEGYSNVAALQLLDFVLDRRAKARLAKAHLEATELRLMLPRVIKVAASKAPAKAQATGFSRTRSSAEVQRAIARRMALR